MPINVAIVPAWGGKTTYFKLKRPRSKIVNLFRAYGTEVGKDYRGLVFLHEHAMLRGDLTVGQTGLKDGDEIIAYEHATGGGGGNV